MPWLAIPTAGVMALAAVVLFDLAGESRAEARHPLRTPRQQTQHAAEALFCRVVGAGLLVLAVLLARAA